MTQKENLLKQAMEVENQIAEVKNEEVKVINVESVEFAEEVRTYTVKELQRRIEYAKTSLARAEKEKAEAEWLASDEGKDFAKRYNEAKETLLNKFDSSEQKAISAFNAIIKANLGEQWGLCSIDESRVRIGIVDTEKPKHSDGTDNSLFGHSFDIDFGKKRWNEGEKFEINYGTMGSFDVNTDASRVDFLIGLAKVASDKELQKKIKEVVDKLQSEFGEIRKEYEAIEAQNPFKK